MIPAVAPRLSVRSADAGDRRDLVCRTGGVRAASLDDAARTVDAVFSTEGRVLVFDYRSFERVEEVLRVDGVELPEQCVMLDDHSRRGNDSVIGSGRTLRIEGREVVGTLHFAAGDERADKIWPKVRDKHLTDVSVGYRVLSQTKIPAGETAVVGGESYTAGARTLHVVTEWELHEISVTPIGADAAAKLRADAGMGEADRGQGADSNAPPASRTKPPTPAVPPALRKYLESLGLTKDADDATAETFRAALTADQSARASRIESGAEQFPAVEKPAGRKKTGEPGERKAVDEGEAARAAVAAERDRCRTLRDLAGDDVPAEVLQRALDEGMTAEEASGEFLAEIRKNRPAPLNGVAGSAGDAGVRALAAAICRTANVPADLLAKEFGEQAVDQAESRGYRGAGLNRLMHETIRAAGMHAPLGSFDDDGVRTYLEASVKLERGTRTAGASTVSLPGVLSNVANKSLLASFLAVPSVCEKIARVGSASNFKEMTHYRLAGNGEMEQVGPDGQIKNTGLVEESFGNRVKTYANMATLTREMMVNDDLNAFVQLPQLFGRKAALTREKLFFKEFLDNSAFFTAGNNNLAAATALSIDGLTAVEGMLVDMPGPDGEPYGVEGKYLLVPTALRVTARELYDQTKTDAVSTSKKPAGNPHAGKFEPITSPFLNNAKIAGGSATAYYLLADPNDVPVIEIAYLNGRRRPTLERSTTDFDTLGQRWRQVWDFGVRKQDPKGGVKNAGV